MNWNDPAGVCPAREKAECKVPILGFYRRGVPVEGTFTHKAEGSLTVSHTRYVCDTSEERAARDLCFLRKTGTRCRIRRQESKFRVQQRRRGKSRHLANDFNDPGAEICIKWEQTRDPYLLLLTHKLIFFQETLSHLLFQVCLQSAR